MIGSAVRAIGWRALCLAVIGLAGSQAGHLLVYRLRFGGRAAVLQSTGTHAYFQAMASGAFALAGVALIAAVGVIGAARVVAGRRSGRSPARPSVLELAAALFTLQLAIFVLQESLESLVSAGSFSPGIVLVYGVACQLPVALAGAVGLSLFLARFEEAVERLWALAPPAWPGFSMVDRRARVPVEADRPAPQRRRAGTGSRGPP